MNAITDSAVPDCYGN